MAYEKQAKQIDKLIRGSRHVVLLQADNPDPDSLGAARAMQISLEAMDIDSSIVCLRRLKGANLELFGQWVVPELPKHYDTVVLLDTGAEHLISRAKKAAGDKLKKKNFIVIDHHPEEEGDFAFADVKLIDTGAPAAAEMVYKLAKELDWPIDREFARAVMLAYMYDSRKFTIGKVKPDTLKVAAELLEYGLNIADINYTYDQAYAIDRQTYKRKGKLIQKVRFYRGGNIAIYSINKRLRAWLKNRGSLSEYLKYELLSVRDVKISIGITKLPEKKVMVTMRAHLPIAQAVAETFGGGGHPQAAGCMMEGVNLRQARRKLVDAVEAQLDEYESKSS